jgi:hypothetical protein
MGEWRCNSTHSLTSALDGSEWWCGVRTKFKEKLSMVSKVISRGRQADARAHILASYLPYTCLSKGNLETAHSEEPRCRWIFVPVLFMGDQVFPKCWHGSLLNATIPAEKFFLSALERGCGRLTEHKIQLWSNSSHACPYNVFNWKCIFYVLQTAWRLVGARSGHWPDFAQGHDLQGHTKIVRIFNEDIQSQVNEPGSLYSNLMATGAFRTYYVWK